MSKIIQPLDGEPNTRQVTGEDGAVRYIITPFELTPWSAQIGKFLARASVVYLFFIGLQVGESYGLGPVLSAIASAYAAWGCYYPLLPIWDFLMKGRTEIVMSYQYFSVRGWLGWEQYDRTLPHTFKVIAHDKTEAEQETLELQLRKDQAAGKIVRRPKYYGKSFHIVFEYAGQRRDVMTVYGQKEALAIAARLKLCDGLLDTDGGNGNGVILSPEDQWDEGPGDID